MGILSDIIEDRSEFIGQLVDARKKQLGLPRTLIETKTFVCNLCSASVKSELDLEKHYDTFHPQDYCYFQINGEIGRDGETFLIDKPVSRCSVVLQGVSRRKLHVFGADYQNVTLDVQSGQDFSSLLPDEFDGRLAICVPLSAGRSVTIFLQCQEKISFEPEKVEPLIREMQNALIGERFDSNECQMHLDRSDFTSIEQKYWDGFFEYSLGMKLEMAGNKNAKARLEKAYYFLFQIVTPLANTAVCILELKMGFFNRLKNCSCQSVFYPASCLIRPDWKSITDYSWNFSRSRAGVFVDSQFIAILKTSALLLSRKLAEAEEELNALESSNTQKSQIVFDIAAILRARLALLGNKYNLAEKYYKILEHHPAFGKEASDFIKGL